MAKIERAEAVAAIDEILAAFDGVMVARGDLAVEIGPERVPLVQKEIIWKASQLYKPAIIVTQTLESMATVPTPTRAEVSDVSNAILDGADAVMLSSETRIGGYPVEAVAMMGRIAAETDPAAVSSCEPHAADVAQATAHAACLLARETDPRAFLVFTASGHIAELVAKHRPSSPVYAVTGSYQTYRRLALHWGLVPLHADGSADGRVSAAGLDETLAAIGIDRPGDRVVVIARDQGEGTGSPETVRVHTVRGRKAPVRLEPTLVAVAA